MNQKDKQLADRIYLILATLFIASLVTSNLIFQKFFYWYPFNMEIYGVKLFEVSVGLLPYPLTFLITDILSEIYGKRKANEVVIAGIFASFFSLLIIYVSKEVPATSWSQVNDNTFINVFGAAPLAATDIPIPTASDEPKLSVINICGCEIIFPLFPLNSLILQPF